MKVSSSMCTVLAMATALVSSTHGQPIVAPIGTEQVGSSGDGYCANLENGIFDYAFTPFLQTITIAECDQLCRQHNDLGGLRGFSTLNNDEIMCYCWYDDGTAPGDSLPPDQCPPDSPFEMCQQWPDGFGEINGIFPNPSFNCFRYLDFPVVTANGDPHFGTWENEHFEFHGQCDLVMTRVKNFANRQGMDLDIHLRTKIVRFWSYIKTASIRIGNDILEVSGSADEDGKNKSHYWINYELRGDLTDLGGFPVTINPQSNKYTIDLGSSYPGQKIEIKTFKEFVGVKIVGATELSFGNAVGITGDFVTGNTYARDGTTVLQDFDELGMEWQVLPSDGKLFHEVDHDPQFPELCFLPEDPPRSELTRRLEESLVTEEQAVAVCSGLKDEFDRKGCVYDILATQHLDMVGAY